MASHPTSQFTDSDISRCTYLACCLPAITTNPCRRSEISSSLMATTESGAQWNRGDNHLAVWIGPFAVLWHIFSVAKFTICCCDQEQEFLRRQVSAIFVVNLESGHRTIAHENMVSFVLVVVNWFR